MGDACGKERLPYEPSGHGHPPFPAGFPVHGGPIPAHAAPGAPVYGGIPPAHGYSPGAPVPAPHSAWHPARPPPPSVPSSATSTRSRLCDRGVECTDFSDEHRRKFSHPEGVLMACQYGAKCFRKNLEHLKQFAHPGDRNYRMGMVHFPVRKGVRVKPDFPSLRSLFNYCDPDESGNISKEEFQAAWEHLRSLPRELFAIEEGNPLAPRSADEAWDAAAGERTHLSFVQFAKWATDVKLQLPVGIDLGHDAERPCRFQYGREDKRCPCASFKAAAHGTTCECGHKSSAHISDVALMTLEEQAVLRRSKTAIGRGLAPARKPGFDMVTNPAVLAVLQKLLSETHKETDNWTRDRGCALHGRDAAACIDPCVYRNRAPVPTGFELVRAERNRNLPLWQTYATTRSAIKQEARASSIDFESYLPGSAQDVETEEALDLGTNEWRLLHGTSLAACKGICGSNFRLKLAGTGATWKDAGKKAGRPLYGYGVYFAESSTKADEYAEKITGGLPIDEGCYAMLVCRVVGGLCRVVDDNEFEPDALLKDVLDGPYHSVFGDRVKKLGKPFREIVVYDNNQIFPEFILYYKRLGMPE